MKNEISKLRKELNQTRMIASGLMCTHDENEIQKLKNDNEIFKIQIADLQRENKSLQDLLKKCGGVDEYEKKLKLINIEFEKKLKTLMSSS